MYNTCRVYPCAVLRPKRPVSFRQPFVFLLALLLSLARPALACPPAPEGEVIFSKNRPLGVETSLDASTLYGYEEQELSHEWYGPFAPATGAAPFVFLPEGTHAVTLLLNDGSRRSEPDTVYVTVEPAFSVSLSARWGSVVLDWPGMEGATRYEIYRAGVASPTLFKKIAEIPAFLSAYLDVTFKDATFLYVVGAYVDGQWLFSDVKSSHSYLRNSSQCANYAPVIYSAPILKGAVSIPYTYDVNAADPNRDAVTYSLMSPPPGMTIDAATGLIEWMPPLLGDYEITVKVKDAKGACVSQIFIVEVDELPGLNRPPTAHAGGPYAGEVNQGLSFDGSASFDPDGDPLLYTWDFGDNTTGSGISPVHAYAAPGSYLVKLTVDDGRGGSSSDTTTATVQTCLHPGISFSASPAAILPGEACTLLWTAENAEAVSIDRGIGAVMGSGSMVVHPESTTTFTATATNRCGTATGTVTVLVHRPPLVDISTAQGSIVAGQTATLTWTSANADAVTIDQGIGVVPASGSLAVAPAATTTYTITAIGPGGTATDSVTVTVQQPPRVSMTAEPSVIIEGETATLSWSAENADSAALDNGMGQVEVNGSLPVSPLETTTYSITVQGAGGTAGASATVTVLHRPVVTLQASPNPITAGEMATLSWSSQNADTASMDQGIGGVEVNGNIQVSPSETTTYTVTATGPGGTATANVTLEVNRPNQPRKNCAYITNYDGGDVTVVDIAANAVLTRIPVGNGPYGVDVSPDGDLVYVTSEEDGISVIDSATNTVVGSIPVNATTVAASPDGSVIYAVSNGEGTLTAMDSASHEILGSVDVGASPCGIAVNPSGTRIFVASLEEGTVRVVDAADLSVMDTLQVSEPGTEVLDIEVSPDGSLVYAVSDYSCQLTVIDARTNSIIRSVSYMPERRLDDAYLAVSPDGQSIYLSLLSNASSIRIIDASSLEILKTIPAGYPSDLSFTPDGAFVYVPDAYTNTVLVIDTGSREVSSILLENDFEYPCTCGHFIAEHRERISGRIVVDGVGVEGVLVTLSDGAFTRDSYTDAQGRYFFYAPPGVYTLTFSSNGYVLSQQNLSVSVADREVSLSDTEVLLGVKIWSEPGSIADGQAAALHWDSARAASVSIDQGIGQVGASGSISVSPSQTTSYTITATNSQGRTATSHVIVTVFQLPTVSVTAEPVAIVRGQSATLAWTSINADALILEPYGWEVEASGSYTVTPSETTTYTLTATGPGGITSTPVTVTVYQPPVVSISAEPESIPAGQSSTLSWSSANAAQVNIDNGIGDVESSGSREVTPAQTTTYSITATGPGGAATASVTITVHQPPVVTISADPDTILTGQSSTLSWSSANATQVSIDNGFGIVAPSGSLAVSPSQTTTYTIIAMGPGGITSASVTVTVNTVISILVNSPTNGSLVDRPDILVRGTVTNPYGHETGVTVNGMPAILHGNEFFANHVSLSPGENAITVRAVDVQGHSSEVVISVNSEVTQPYITLSGNDIIGISPFDTTLRVESFFEPGSMSFSDTGPGQVEYFDGAESNERIAQITDAGVYFITANVSQDGVSYADTIGLAVYDRDSLDAALRQKWEDMRTALMNNDIETAVKDLSRKTKAVYRNAFGYLTSEQRGNLAHELEDLQFIKMGGNAVEYDIQTTRNGTLYSFFLLFELDEDGMWKIANF